MPTVPERGHHDVVKRILMVKWYSVPQSTPTGVARPGTNPPDLTHKNTWPTIRSSQERSTAGAHRPGNLCDTN